MKAIRRTLYVLFSVLITLNAWGEGEPRPSGDDEKSAIDEVEAQSENRKPAPPTEGPHHGFLQPAGDFQLELIWESDLSLKVYLLDADYKNETVQNSEIGVFIQSGHVESEMSCQPVENYFECKQSGKKFKKGTLAISAKRSGRQAEELKVTVPFEKKAEAKKNRKTKDIKK